MSAGKPRKLPRAIAARLADVHRHYAALRHAMGSFGDDFDLDEFEAASVSDDPDELARVYAVERPFELLDNYIIELAQGGLVEARVLKAGERPASGIDVLRRLRDEGVISKARCDRLERIHRVRTDIQHQYPDLRSHSLHEAIYLLAAELPEFLRDYSRWLQTLGFGKTG